MMDILDELKQKYGLFRDPAIGDAIKEIERLRNLTTQGPLLERPEPQRIKRDYWIYLYPNTAGISEKGNNPFVRSNLLAKVKIKIDCKEGDGLDLNEDDLTVNEDDKLMRLQNFSDIIKEILCRYKN